MKKKFVSVYVSLISSIQLFAMLLVAMVLLGCKNSVEGKKFSLADYQKTELVTVTSSKVTITDGTEIAPFAIGKYEVTQELYEVVMGTNPSWFNGASGKEAAPGETQKLRPVEMVSWYDAITFCNKLSIKAGLTPVYSVEGVDFAENVSVPTGSDAAWNAATMNATANGYRLPTAAEWEFAARGGVPKDESWNYTYAGTSDKNDLVNYAWYAENSDSKTHEVGKKQPNSLGLHDMSGNVQERCYDLYDDDEASRISRGGCWWKPASLCEVELSQSGDPYSRFYILGFRLARSL